jgi:hypothetical protein
MVESGLPLDRIQARTGIWPDTVIRWADQEGVPRYTCPPHPEGVRARAVKRVLGGEPAADVAADLSVRLRTVYGWVQAARGGVDGRRAPHRLSRLS